MFIKFDRFDGLVNNTNWCEINRVIESFHVKSKRLSIWSISIYAGLYYSIEQTCLHIMSLHRVGILSIMIIIKYNDIKLSYKFPCHIYQSTSIKINFRVPDDVFVFCRWTNLISIFTCCPTFNWYRQFFQFIQNYWLNTRNYMF